MKRRSFMQMLAALVLIPVLPKVAAKPKCVTVAKGTAELQGWTDSTPYHPGDIVKLGNGALPAGYLCCYYGDHVPKGWVWCDGQKISAREHPELTAILPSAKLPKLEHFIIKK